MAEGKSDKWYPGKNLARLRSQGNSTDKSSLNQNPREDLTERPTDVSSHVNSEPSNTPTTSDKPKEGWYPGKHLKKLAKGEPAESSRGQKSPDGWYPGKHMKKLAPGSSQAANPKDDTAGREEDTAPSAAQAHRPIEERESMALFDKSVEDDLFRESQMDLKTVKATGVFDDDEPIVPEDESPAPIVNSQAEMHGNAPEEVCGAMDDSRVDSDISEEQQEEDFEGRLAMSSDRPEDKSEDDDDDDDVSTTEVTAGPGKEKWYLGKHVKRLVVGGSQAGQQRSSSADSTEESRGGDAWFPGKHIKKIASSSVPAGEDSDVDAWYPGKRLKHIPRPLLGLKRRLIHKRNLRQHTTRDRIGTLRVSLLQGRALAAARPYVEIICEGFEHRTKTAKTGDCEWSESNYVFNVQDVTANLTLLLFDDYNFQAERCVGRVVIPLTECLDGSTAKQKVRGWYRIFPALVSDSEAAANERFESGVLGVPGSAMVRPRNPLGYFLVELELTLVTSVPSAYVLTEPWLTSNMDAQRYDSKGMPMLEPRLLRSNIARLKRVIRQMKDFPIFSPLLRVCLLFPVLIHVCFVATGVWVIPLWMFILQLINGILLFHHQAHKRKESLRDGKTVDGIDPPNPSREWLLVWEDELGPSTMPRGPIAKINLLKETVAKLQLLIGKFATALELYVSVWSWEDSMVTFLLTSVVGLLCFLLAVVLYLTPINVLGFALGALLLFKPSIASKHNQTDATTTEDESQVEFDEDGIMRESGNGIEMIPTKAKEITPGAEAGETVSPKTMLKNLLRRVPDAKELAHRHICGMQGPITETEVVAEIKARRAGAVKKST